MNLLNIINILDIALPTEKPDTDMFITSLLYVLPVVVIAIIAAIVVKTKKKNNNEPVTKQEENKNA